MDDRALMQVALDALEYEAKRGNDDAYLQERKALRDRLAQPEQQYLFEANHYGSDRLKIDPVTGDVSIGTPVHASDISQECVDETGKDRHKPEERMRIEHAGHVSPKPWPTQFDNDPSKWYEQIGKIPKREWVGLTEEELKTWKTVPIFEGVDPDQIRWIARKAEETLRERNT